MRRLGADRRMSWRGGVAAIMLTLGGAASATLRPEPPEPVPVPPTPPRVSSQIVILESDTLSEDNGRGGRSFGEIRISRGRMDTLRVKALARKRLLEGERGPDLVRFGERIVVAEDQEIEGDVVAIGGDVDVYGRVHGDVVSVGGVVNVKPGGAVDGDVVSAGGGVDKAPGARIKGADIGLRFVPAVRSWLWGGHGLGLGAAFGLKLVGLGILLLWGWLVTSTAPRQLWVVGAQVRDHLWTSLFAGVAVLILAIPVALLLAVTLIGIPVAILVVVLVFGIAWPTGYVIVSGIAGRHFRSGAGEEDRVAFKDLAVGLLIVAGALVLGDLLRNGAGPLRVIGNMALFFALAVAGTAATVGLGALALTRLGRRPCPPTRESTEARDPAPAPPPAPYAGV